MTKPITGVGPIGDCCDAGGGGGGAVDSFNGRTGVVTSQPGDYSPADVGALAIAGGTMLGPINLDGHDLISAGAATATTFNAVPLTAAGDVNNSLREDGSYALIFGSQHQEAVRTTPLVTSDPAPQSYLLLTTPAIPAGLYYLSPTLVITVSSNNTIYGAEVRVNGVTRGGPIQSPGIAGGVGIFGGTFPEPLAPGVNTFELFIFRQGGSGSVTATFGSIIIWRAA